MADTQVGQKYLREADGAAHWIKGAVSSACHQVSIAGQVRRRCQVVDRLELVVVPKLEAPDGNQATLALNGGSKPPSRHLLHERLSARSCCDQCGTWSTLSPTDRTQMCATCGRRSVLVDVGFYPLDPCKDELSRDQEWRQRCQDTHWRLWLTRHQTVCEVYLVSPQAWAGALLCHTGPKSFVDGLERRWAEKGGAFEDWMLYDSEGQWVPTISEEAIFAACGLLPVEPEKREEFQRRQELKQATSTRLRVLTQTSDCGTIRGFYPAPAGESIVFKGARSLRRTVER